MLQASKHLYNMFMNSAWHVYSTCICWKLTGRLSVDYFMSKDFDVRKHPYNGTVDITFSPIQDYLHWCQTCRYSKVLSHHRVWWVLYTWGSPRCHHMCCYSGSILWLLGNNMFSFYYKTPQIHFIAILYTCHNLTFTTLQLTMFMLK